MWFVFLVLIIIAIVLVITNMYIVPQSMTYVVELMGKYYATWPAGVHFKVPFFSRIAKKVSLKEQVADFKPQPVITGDNVTMQIDTVMFFQVT
ncbi:MAG: SPFH domain-containing protein, partial [Ruthenibacterium sp.]